MAKKKNKNKKRDALTPKELIFCCEYVIEWNGTKSVRKAYPNVTTDNSAAVKANKLLRKGKIKAYIEKIKDDFEKQAGITKLGQLKQLKPLSESSILETHNDWFELKDFNTIPDWVKSAIKEVKTEKRTIRIGDDGDEVIETVLIKFHDKRAAIETINKMMAYNKERGEELGSQEINVYFGKD